MTLIITVAYLSVLACALFVLIRWPMLRCTGEQPVGVLTLVALLFTAGLDMGLVMLPLLEGSPEAVRGGVLFAASGIVGGGAH